MIRSRYTKPFAWSPDKNQRLIEERGVSFEDVIFSLHEDGLLDDIEHPNERKYPGQRVFVVAVDGYAHLVPYMETEDVIFLGITPFTPPALDGPAEM